MVELAPSIAGQIDPIACWAASQLDMLKAFSCCARWLMSFITPPICAEMLSIASWKANPIALLAVAFSMATISSALMKLKLPAKRSIPPHPARALGNATFTGLIDLDGKRLQRLPPE